MNFKELISKRRACKLFNDKKINEKDLHFILESGVLAPSSHGFEPWKFVVLEQKEHNLKLSTLCYNQQNVASASHNIIFLARKDLQSKDEFAQKQVRRFSDSSEENFQKILEIYTHKTNAMNDNELYHYAQLQCYLAMMQMSLAAMSLGIDSCMIGGFEKAKVDDFLNLTYPFETAVILSLGGFEKAKVDDFLNLTYPFETAVILSLGGFEKAKVDDFLNLTYPFETAVILSLGGFEKAKVDDFLNLTYPFETAVILSLGYKAYEPKYSTQRLNFNEVVEFYKEK